MSNIIPLSEGKIPARFKGRDVAALVAEFSSGGGGGGFPVISIKGGKFAIIENKERRILPNPKDPDSPATSIEILVLRTNPGKAKVFYAKTFKEGEDMGKPDCSSNDGVVPEASVTKPVAKSCAACPKNMWGSKVYDDGQKGRACADSKKLAVATSDDLETQYLIRVPAASLRGWDEYVQALAKRGIPANEVVTKISFDPETASPKLLFKPVGFVDDETAAKVQGLYDDDKIKQIVGLIAFAGHAADEVFETPAEPKVEVKPEPKKEKKVEAKPEPKVEAEVVDSGDLDLDGLSFDD